MDKSYTPGGMYIGGFFEDDDREHGTTRKRIETANGYIDEEGQEWEWINNGECGEGSFYRVEHKNYDDARAGGDNH